MDVHDINVFSNLDELSDLRGQVKLLEEKNTKYMQENLELQEVRLLSNRCLLKVYHLKLPGWIYFGLAVIKKILNC